MFIAKFVPLKQWVYDEIHSPKHQKFKTDKLPIILNFEKLDYKFLIDYYFYRYKYILSPIKRRDTKTVPVHLKCPHCGAPHEYLYPNNGNNGQYLCTVCGERFSESNHVEKPLILKYPYYGSTLEHKKSRLHFRIHKCINKNCSYYLANLRKLPKDLQPSNRYKYKLHYIYREFTVDFFKMNLYELPSWATSFSFKKYNAHIMGLSLTYHVNLGLFLRKTAHALKEVHGITISHTMIANYAKTAAVIVKPFVDNYDYNPSHHLAVDETYIKVRSLKGFVWFIMDTVSRSILGYQVSDNRGVGPCILTMRMAFDKFKKFPKHIVRFIADGYSAYPLQFLLKEKPFEVTPVIGLTNDDEVSRKFRQYKQIIERLNRTFKSSYRVTCGYNNDDGHLGVSLWVAYYNFLRPHKLYHHRRPLNLIAELGNAGNMLAKWQLLIYYGQQTILSNQQNSS